MDHLLKYELIFSAKRSLTALKVQECNKQANFCNKLPVDLLKEFTPEGFSQS